MPPLARTDVQLLQLLGEWATDLATADVNDGFGDGRGIERGIGKVSLKRRHDRIIGEAAGGA